MTEATSDAAGGAFDAALESAVRRFQHRHGLAEDGIVADATLAALNVPVETRVDQVRLTLERMRWVARDAPSDALIVNAAGAHVYLLFADTIAFQARTVVGTPRTRTPVFRATMDHVVLNPSWTVPGSIVGEILTALRQDPDYRTRAGMRIVDRSGSQVAVSREDLLRFTPATFPWAFRQDPGPANPLGRVKFVFPNRYNVYLHDTPARDLFERDVRTWSHGCVRVEDPLQLAARILRDPDWTVDALERAIRTGRTRVLPLERAMPVLVLYWTAMTDRDGVPHFYSDVYGRDRVLLPRLNAP